MGKAAATDLRDKMMQADRSRRNKMRQLKVRSSKTALLTLTRSHQWTDKMVYILAANKSNRPAASAVYKASEAFYQLRGVRTIDVHIVTCAPRKAMQTWRRLESALLDVFRNKYFELPKYNKVRPTTKEGLFSPNVLDKIISKFGVE